MNEQCDMCGEVREVKFSNPRRVFCSAACANRYLQAEGFAFRICINCECQKTLGGQQVCNVCIGANAKG